MSNDYIGKKVKAMSNGKVVTRVVYEVKTYNGKVVGVYVDLDFDSDYRDIDKVEFIKGSEKNG